MAKLYYVFYPRGRNSAICGESQGENDEKRGEKIGGDEGIKVFMLYLLAVGCITAVLVGFALGRVMSKAVPASTTAQAQFSAMSRPVARPHGAAQTAMPAPLLPAFYRELAPDVDPAYRVGKDGCAMLPGQSLKVFRCPRRMNNRLKRVADTNGR